MAYLKEAFRVSGHDLYNNTSRSHIACRHCGKRAPRSSGVRPWFESGCQGSLVVSKTSPHQFVAIGPPLRVLGQGSDLSVYSTKRAKEAQANRRSSFIVWQKCIKAYLDLQIPCLGAPLHSPSLAADAPLAGSQAYSWMLELHPSHTLYLAGGVVCCSQCGRMQSLG